MMKRMNRILHDEITRLDRLFKQPSNSVASRMYAVKKLRRLEDSLEDMNLQLDRFKALLW